jgi:hypothetical protein
VSVFITRLPLLVVPGSPYTKKKPENISLIAVILPAFFLTRSVKMYCLCDYSSCHTLSQFSSNGSIPKMGYVQMICPAGWDSTERRRTRFRLQGKNRSFPDVWLEKPLANSFFRATSFFSTLREGVLRQVSTIKKFR